MARETAMMGKAEAAKITKRLKRQDRLRATVQAEAQKLDCTTLTAAVMLLDAAIEEGKDR